MDIRFFGPINDAKLVEINKELSLREIPHGRRPFEALTLMGYSVPLDSPEAKYVFDWFQKRSRTDAFQIGSLYDSVFFYDMEFWPIKIPLFFGTVRIDPFKCLKDISEHAMAELVEDSAIVSEYIEHFKNSIDFGVAKNSVLEDKNLSEFGRGMFDGACRSLASAAVALSLKRPNNQAMQDARQAIENFFKASGAFAGNVDYKRAKEMSHKLLEGLKEFGTALGLPANTTKDIEQRLNVYPDIQVRYKTVDFSAQELWQGFRIAQYIGALTTRKFSDHPILELDHK